MDSGISAGTRQASGQPAVPGVTGVGIVRLLSGLTVAMALSSFALQARELAQQPAGWPLVAVAALLHAAFVLAHLLPYRFPGKSAGSLGAAGAAAAAVLALALMPGSRFLTFWLFLPVVSEAQFILDRRSGLWAAVAVWALALLALAGVTARASPGTFWLDALSMTTGFVFATAVSFLACTQMQLRFEVQKASDDLRRSHEELEQAHRQLQAYAAQVEELAVLRERNRLAQEIHDTLAHTLTGLIMQLEVAATLMEAGGAAAGQALSAVRRALASACQGLAEVRRAVCALYPELLQGLPLGESLRRLASQFSEQTGIAVAFRESGDAAPLAPPVQVVLFRALQETLTNAGRHGKARRVDVLLEWSGADVRLSAYDDGTGALDFSPGFGLLSMQERAAAFGGTVRIDNRPEEGFGVTVAIPLRPA